MGKYAFKMNIRTAFLHIQEQIPEILLFDHAGSVLPHLDLHQHLGWLFGACKIPLNHPRLGNAVKSEGKIHPLLHKPADPLKLYVPHNLVGNKDVPKSVGGHDLRLAHLCDSDPLCPLLLLKQGQLRDLVGLCVGAQGHVIPVRIVLHKANVVHHNLPVNEHGRRIQFHVVHILPPAVR